MIGIVLIWLALIGAFVATLLFARPKGARLDPSCGKCGYLVRGLSTFICPECGSDLREVGIVSGPSAGHVPLRSNLPAKLLLAIVIYAPIGFTMGMVLLAYGPSLPLSDVVNDGLLAAMPPILGLIGVIVWILRRHKPDDATTEAASQPAAPGARRTRNLSIIFVDMHEYTTRVSRESRDGVIELVRRSRDLIQPIVHRRGGKIVKTIGDAFLITFDSPTDAVLTAREIQSGAIGLDAVKFRIGISTGEVALEANDVYGEPVNIANRIQQLAQPGEILFNEATFHAMTRSEVPHEVAGDFDLKGVNGQVRLYRALSPS